jgi:hypothetical protein
MSTVNFYKIVCLQGGMAYVGSTCSPLHVVLHKYENNYRRYLDGKINFHSSFIVLQRGTYTIQLIDSVQCNDKKIRNTIEALYILNEDAVNQCPPEHDNKEKIKQNKNETIDCACGGKFIKTHQARHMKSKKHIAYLETQEQEKQNEKRQL